QSPQLGALRVLAWPGKVQIELVMLANAGGVCRVLLEELATGVIEKVRQRVGRAANAKPIQHVAIPGRTKKLADASCAKIQLSAARAPQVQRQPIRRDL